MSTPLNSTAIIDPASVAAVKELCITIVITFGAVTCFQIIDLVMKYRMEMKRLKMILETRPELLVIELFKEIDRLARKYGKLTSEAKKSEIARAVVMRDSSIWRKILLTGALLVIMFLIVQMALKIFSTLP